MEESISTQTTVSGRIQRRSMSNTNEKNPMHTLKNINLINVLYVGSRSNIANILHGATADDETRLNVITVRTISDASRTLSEGPIECIVSDYDLADGTGIEFLRTIRSENISIPFILYPAEGSEKIASKAISAGVSEYIHQGSNSRQWNYIVDQIVTTVKKSQSQPSSDEVINQLSSLIEHTPIGIIQWDENLRLERINTCATDILGESKEELQKTSLEEIISTLTTVDNEITSQHLSSSDHCKFEFLSPNQEDNKYMRYEWRNHVLSDEDNNTISAFTYIQRCDNRGQSAGRIEYKTIIESLSDAVYVLDEKGLFTYVNEEFVELVGYDRKKIIGNSPSLIKNEKDVTKGKHKLRSLLSDDGSETVTFEITLQRADGTTVLCEDHMGVLPYDGDTFEGSVGVLRDITEQRKQEKLFEAFVEGTDDIVSVVDSDGTIQYQEPSVKHILGYSPDEVTDKNIWQYIHPDDREAIKSEFFSFKSSPDEKLNNVEYRVRHSNGSWKWMEANGSDQSDCPAVSGYIINSRDISPRKEREQQLQLFDRVLRHNLRNDLNVIRGSADTIKSKSSSEAAWLASKVVNNSDKLLATANKQRKIMRILRDKPTQVGQNLYSIIQEVVADMESNYPNAVFNIDCPNDTVVTVADHFSSVIREAIQNSIIHSNTENPKVDVVVTDAEEQTTISISDQGPPVPKMEQRILTDVENQTPLYHGSGLGLWLIKVIVDRSGGTASFAQTSEPGNTLEINILE